jgi:hypothetical protein
VILFGRRHPTQLSLSRFADGDLVPHRLRRIGRHVQRCETCREYVRFINELGDVARELKRDDMPDVSALADAVIRRRRAGERGPEVGIVPEWANGDEEAATPRRRRAGRAPAGSRRFAGAIAAGLALVAATSAYLLLAPSAAATRGELSFGPIPPAGPAATIPIEYEPAYYLAEEDSLRLRVEVGRPPEPEVGGHRSVVRRTVTLHRDDDGKFRGYLPLEEGDLSAVAAVEDFDAVDLDTNSGRLWELYLAFDNGEPTLAALESRYRTLERYNLVMAIEWADSLAEAEPHNPLGLTIQYMYLSNAAPEPVPDSVRELHRNRLAELIRGTGARAGGGAGSLSADLEVDELKWLATYARMVGEMGAHDSLMGEVARRASDHPMVTDRRALAVLEETGSDLRRRLARLEHLWAALDHPTPLIVYLGTRAAAAVGDVDALESWLDRGRRHPGVRTPDLLGRLEGYDELAAQRLRLLQAAIAELKLEADERPLRTSALEHEADLRRRALEVDLALADALVATGDTAVAARVYERAIEHAWRAEDIRPYVDFLLARGDTAAALPLVGIVAADPLYGDSALAEFAEIIGATTDDVGSFVEQSRRELARRMHATLPDRRRIRGDVLLGPLGSDDVEARTYLADRPTVLLVWSPRLRDTSGQLAEFEELAKGEKMAEAVRAALMVPIEDNQRVATLDAVDFPVLLDPTGQLTAQVPGWELRSYLVVDQNLAIAATVLDGPTAFRIAKVLTW